MVGDSMHSAIEGAAKNKSIYTQNEWCAIMQSAKVNDPKYAVFELDQSEIFDFTSLANKKSWTKIKVSKLSMIEISSEKVTYDYSYAEKPQSITTIKNTSEPLRRAYLRKLTLDEAKANDLKKLMKERIIPSEYHHFYYSLM